jgi:hypothetical protein
VQSVLEAAAADEAEDQQDEHDDDDDGQQAHLSPSLEVIDQRRSVLIGCGLAGS